MEKIPKKKNNKKVTKKSREKNVLTNIKNVKDVKDEKKKATINGKENVRKNKSIKNDKAKNDNTLLAKARAFFVELEKNFSSLFKKEKDIKYISEYYEVPYRYDETTVKIIAQNPYKLYVYWDISNKKKEELISNYGKDFFTKTTPVLIVTNKSTNESFEVEVNDFANSWYIDIPDNSSKYIVELARKVNDTIYIDPINGNKEKIEEKNKINNTSNNKKTDEKDIKFNYLNAQSKNSIQKIEKGSLIILNQSNTLISQNGHILGIPNSVTFRNIHDNSEKTYNIKEFQKSLNSIYDYINEFEPEKNSSSSFI